MAERDWWATEAGPGELAVTELVADDSLRQRALATPNVREIPLAEFSLAGRQLVAEVGHLAHTLRDGDEHVARLARPTHKGEPWLLDLAGRQLSVTHERADLPSGEGRNEQVYFLLLRSADRSWVAHFSGGRVAGETFVVGRGALPRAEPVVVSCVPAARTRKVPTGRLRRRQAADTHVTRWTAEASPAEVLVAQMLLLSGLHAGVDYLGASMVGAARELAGMWRMFSPAPDPLPTKTEG